MRKALGLLLLLAVVTACVPDPPPGRGPNPTLTVSTVVSGFDHIWDIAFTPDGQWMIFDERVGKIWAKNLTTGETRFLGGPSDVVVHGEGGLLGLALDPNFGISNQFIYACYDTVADVRVVRFTTDLSPNSLAVNAGVVTGMPVNTATGRHSGCRPRFRPGTNQLFIGTGDTATDGTIPQNLHSLGGKVLCVTTDGNPCSNNPGVVNPSFDIDDRIWSWGHRNVQGIAFSATTGAAFTIEHGTGRDDEVNVMFQGNFGWDPGPFFYDESHPMTAPGGIEAAWSSGAPTIAPSGGTILSGSQWRGWQGAAAIAVLKGQHLLVMFFDDFLGFSSIGTTTNMRGAGRLRSAVQGPDGNLYVSTDNGGGNDGILRAVPS